MKPANQKIQQGKHSGKKPQANQTPKKPEPNLKLTGSTKWAILIGLVVFTFVIYGNSIANGYSGDDDIITLRNSAVQEGVKGIGKIFSKGFLYWFNGHN